MGEHGDAAGVYDLCHGILVLIDKILGHVLDHELVSLLWHPGVDKGSEVEERGAIEGRLVVNELVGGVGIDPL